MKSIPESCIWNSSLSVRCCNEIENKAIFSNLILRIVLLILIVYLSILKIKKILLKNLKVSFLNQSYWFSFQMFFCTISLLNKLIDEIFILYFFLIRYFPSRVNKNEWKILKFKSRCNFMEGKSMHSSNISSFKNDQYMEVTKSMCVTCCHLQ